MDTMSSVEKWLRSPALKSDFGCSSPRTVSYQQWNSGELSATAPAASSIIPTVSVHILLHGLHGLIFKPLTSEHFINVYFQHRNGLSYRRTFAILLKKQSTLPPKE